VPVTDSLPQTGGYAFHAAALHVMMDVYLATNAFKFCRL
jgi:hypothetical protein